MKITFDVYMHYMLVQPAFLHEFDRLHKTNVLLRGSSFERQIDLATGRWAKDVAVLLEFLHDLWQRLPLDVRGDDQPADPRPTS